MGLKDTCDRCGVCVQHWHTSRNGGRARVYVWPLLGYGPDLNVCTYIRQGIKQEIVVWLFPLSLIIIISLGVLNKPWPTIQTLTNPPIKDNLQIVNKSQSAHQPVHYLEVPLYVGVLFLVYMPEAWQAPEGKGYTSWSSSAVKSNWALCALRLRLTNHNSMTMRCNS